MIFKLIENKQHTELENALQENPNLSAEILTQPKNISKWFFGNYKPKIESNLQPIHFCALHNNVEALKILQNYNVNLESLTPSSKTPLSIATIAGATEVVDYLIHQGVNLDTVDKNGMASLHFAAEDGHFDIVKILVDNGANIDQPCYDVGPVHHGMASLNYKLVNSLFRKNIMFDDLNDLIESNPRYNHDEFKRAVGTIHSVIYLLEAGADTSLTSNNGSNVDFCFAATGDPQFLKYISDWNFKNNEERTPFLETCRSKSTEAIQFALDQGANPFIFTIL